MFRVKADPTFRVPVPLSRPGQAKPIEVDIEFRHKNLEQWKDWCARGPGRLDTEMLDEVIVSWDGFIDAAGEPVPYSITALTGLLLEYQTAAGELMAAYNRELTQAKKKT